jgi:tRNA nucleotidyltransferase (CCA-adding enzyme)
MKLHSLKKIIRDLDEKGFLSWTNKLYKNKGVEIYLVGGAVRDALLNIREIKDYDFVVRGLGLEDLGKKLKRLGKVDLVGKKFGVYKFIPSGKRLPVAYDIALPRKEISLMTGRYRDFRVDYDETLDIREDLGRRDFTVNAMAYEIKKDNLVDEFKGIQHLREKIIKTVGNAYERFEEDYSRMLRGLRFACQFDWQIEKSTWEAIKKLMGHINNQYKGERVVPYEVIASELLKTFVANPLKAFDLYDKSEAFMALMPELLKMKDCPQPTNWHSEGDVWEHTRLCLKNLHSEAFAERFKESIIFNNQVKTQNSKLKSKEDLYNVELVMALLWHDMGKPYTIQTPKKDRVDRIRFNNHDVLGAEMAKKNFEKLKLSAAPEFDFEPERAAWLIAKHHLFDSKTIKEMKNSTVEKYFFAHRYSGEDLLKLGFIDMLSSIQKKTGEGDLGNFELIVKRINELKRLGKDKNLPKPLLNGDEIMEILKIKPGKKIGEILENLREKQLAGKIKTKKGAREYIKKI